MRAEVLITASELRRLVAGGTPVAILDVRWELASPDGRAAYEAGHVPGAVYVSLDDDLTDHTVVGRGRHPLPSGHAVQTAARRWGISTGTPVVVYDDWNRAGSARAWWVLKAAGLTDVRILDGGLAAWIAADGRLQTGGVRPEPGNVTVVHDDLYAGGMSTLSADDVAHPGGGLIDARAPERFRGDVEPLDPVAGHIPGAVNLPFTSLLDAAGAFRSDADLRGRLGEAGSAYCGSGVTAAVAVAALAAVGVDAALFPGSCRSGVQSPTDRSPRVDERPDVAALMETVIIIDVMHMSTLRMVAAAVVLVAPVAACSSGGSGSSASTSAAAQGGPCPSAPVDVVVSVDQWGDIVSQLGGGCAQVKTLLASSSVDPHDYEPSPADAVTFTGAKLVVVNGAHYDEWATKLAAGSAPDAPLINAADTGGETKSGDHASVNPHVWYNPATVIAVADAVTAELSKLAPASADYFAARRREFTTSLESYDRHIAAIRAGAAGKTYATTESVFDYMATSVGLQNKTPQGYQAAASNETDPSPADLDAFLKLLAAKGVDVLVYNTQTEGSGPAQIRTAAEAAGIPVVEVTETVAPGATSFEAWQTDQLTALAKALGVNT